MVSRRNGIKNTDCSAMFSHEKYNFEKRCGELVKFNWIQCLILAGGPPSRYLILRTFGEVFDMARNLVKVELMIAII